jgi:hypothetical protein
VSNRRRPPSARDDAVAHHPAMRAAVLHYLKEVARGSSRKADDALNIASSAINRQISKLDADLGVRLSDRMPDGMRLTSAGEVLLRHVRATLQRESLPLVPFIDDDCAVFRSTVQPRFVSNSIEMLRQDPSQSWRRFLHSARLLTGDRIGRTGVDPACRATAGATAVGPVYPAQRTLPPATVAVVNELAARPQLGAR